VLLAKLEGNNPAGSVKDRPALSMIVHAEQRGEIKPGDTLIEATSGNTGIALAMAAAMKGYRMILVMPENQSVERRQSMRAFGAELVLTVKEGGMELARDTAQDLRKAGRGFILDQFSNPDNPLAHYQGTAPEIWRDTGRQNHSFCQQHGYHRHHHGLCAVLQGAESKRSDHRRATGGGCADSRHPQMARSVFADHLPSSKCGQYRTGGPGRRGGNDAQTGARRGYFLRNFIRGGAKHLRCVSRNSWKMR